MWAHDFKTGFCRSQPLEMLFGHCFISDVCDHVIEATSGHRIWNFDLRQIHEALTRFNLRVPRLIILNLNACVSHSRYMYMYIYVGRLHSPRGKNTLTLVTPPISMYMWSWARIEPDDRDGCFVRSCKPRIGCFWKMLAILLQNRNHNIILRSWACGSNARRSARRIRQIVKLAGADSITCSKNLLRRKCSELRGRIEKKSLL